MLSGLTWSNLAIEEVAEEVLCVEHGQTEAGQLVGNPEVSKCHREKRSTSNATLHGGYVRINSSRVECTVVHTSKRNVTR